MRLSNNLPFKLRGKIMQIVDQLLQEKIVAVIRAESKEKGFQLAKAIIKGGFKAIEITFTIPEAERLISQLKAEYDDDILIGAGTVIDSNRCKKAIDHGAQYIVAPGFDKASAEYCYEKNIPYLPGCMTVTEMMTALNHHVAVIKLFPGSHFGPKFIKNIKAPLPDIKVMVTGGVDLNNIKEWLNNGADLIGIGSALTNPQGLESVSEVARMYKNKIEGVK